MRASGENLLAFFVQFCTVLVYGEKNMLTFYQLGKKYAYFLPGRGGRGVKQKNIHPCIYNICINRYYRKLYVSGEQRKDVENSRIKNQKVYPKL